MARPNSSATGNYIATPPRAVPWIGRLLRLETSLSARQRPSDQRRMMTVVDPCAADGAAIFGVMQAAYGELVGAPIDFNLIEMEATRHAALVRAATSPEIAVRAPAAILHGDAFCVAWETAFARQGASVLYLNPPYEPDATYEVLEARWLRRFMGVLCVGGVLLFVIPGGSLRPCAEMLARHFAIVGCYRLPSPEFEAYRQVVLVATRIDPLLEADPRRVAELAAWAAAPEALPVLGPDVGSIVTPPTFFEHEYKAGFSRWEVEPLDLTAITRAYVPWRTRDRRGELHVVPGVLPPEGGAGMRELKIQTAMPPHAGHIANALALDLFDGVRLEPDDPNGPLGPILLKAAFRREWITVERKTNAKKEIIGERQREKPSLIMTALDLRSGTYHRIRSSVEPTTSTSLSEMTAADILRHYSQALLAALRARCPSVHDPSNHAHARALPPELDGVLWGAQREIVIAGQKLLELYGAALVLGQTGVGKTRVAIASMIARGAKRILVFCPPHLVDDPWRDELRAAWPSARTMLLEHVADVDTFANDRDPRPLVAILAETKGKLGHAWAGIGDTSDATSPRHLGDPLPVGREVIRHRATYLSRATRALARPAALAIVRCPRCGFAPEQSPEARARGRQVGGAGRCSRRIPRAVAGLEAAASIAFNLAEVLLPFFPGAVRVREFVQSPGALRLADAWERCPPTKSFDTLWASALSTRRLHRIAWRMSRPFRTGKHSLAEGALGRLLATIDDDTFTAAVVRAIYVAPTSTLLPPAAMREAARRLMLTMRPGQTAQAELAVELSALAPQEPAAWRLFAAKIATLLGARPLYERGAENHCRDQAFLMGSQVLHYGAPRGARELALAALEKFAPLAGVELGPPCGEFLFEAVPSPRRVPLSAYLAKRHPGVVDFVVIDEVHRCQDQDSAESAALDQWRGTPMMGLTGSFSNGYAASLFFLLHIMSPLFRAEFGREDLPAFTRRFGFSTQWVECRDRSSREIVAFGTQSDRIERKVKTLGDAPGTMPDLIVRHLLPIALFLHLDDLEIDLPPCSEILRWVDPGPVLGAQVRQAREELVRRIKADRYTPRHGALFGAMGLEWASADLAGVGNEPDGVFRLRYPEHHGGDVVAAVNMPVSEILPKEAEMLAVLKAELAEGRNVLVCAWHSAAPIRARLAALIEHELGERAVVLDSEKVQARTRDSWIVREVIEPKVRIMIANPASVGTGFNKLTYFSTVIWFQQAALDPKADRQLLGRVRRPGQTKEQRIYRLLYTGTSQELVHQLLLWKIAASLAVDGLDDTAALISAGVDVDDEMTGFALGEQLYRMTLREMGESIDG